MPVQRTIGSFFTAPASTLNPTIEDESLNHPPSSPLSPCPPSSPLSPCPSNISLHRFSSPIMTRSTLAGQDPLKDAHGPQVPSSDLELPNHDAIPEAGLSRPTSFGTSFASSQRVVKDGQVMVTGSDGEDTESICSQDSTDALLRQFLGSPGPSSPSGRKETNTRLDGFKIPTTPTKYKFSLDDLVVGAVDDRETEANVSKLKSAFESPANEAKVNRTPKQRSRMFRDNIFASAVGEGADELKLQRLKDAVDRTEAFDQGKSWSFFADSVAAVLVPEFPETTVVPGSWESVLIEPATRERAFLSGLVGESLSGTTLPDEILLWILQACTAEPRDEVRFAYCSAIKVAPKTRVSSVIQARHIEQMFRDLGAQPDALFVQDVIIPDFRGSKQQESRRNGYLLSALDVVSGLAPKLGNEARDYALKITLRITLDDTYMYDCLLSAAIQQAITCLLGESEPLFTDQALYEISVVLFDTIQDINLQSQVLKYIPPVTQQIALFRCRLAIAFFLEDKTFLDIPAEHVFDLSRMTSRLRDDRFKTNRPATEGWEPFDYWEIIAITSILDIAVGSGTNQTSFPTKESEASFNRQVDRLADQIKTIFTAIHDTGASHLKRTEAKEMLQALHYRLIYSVRTKPRPKVSWFVPSSKDGGDTWTGIQKSENLMERFLSCRKDDLPEDEDLSNTAAD